MNDAALLTKRQREILQIMADHDEELVYERGTGYVGLERIGKHIVFGLLHLCALRLEDGCEVGKFERYTINGTGRDLLRRASAGKNQNA